MVKVAHLYHRVNAPWVQLSKIAIHAASVYLVVHVYVLVLQQLTATKTQMVMGLLIQLFKRSAKNMTFFPMHAVAVHKTRLHLVLVLVDNLVGAYKNS